MILTKNKAGYYRNGVEITETEYNKTKEIIRNRPIAPDGYKYRLTEELKWELCELPRDSDVDPELTDEEALDLIVNGGTA